jgi:hypothetical protein
VRNSLKGIIEDSKMPYQGAMAVEIAWRSYLFCNLMDRNSLTMELTLLILKKMHPTSKCGMRISEFGIRNQKLDYFTI